MRLSRPGPESVAAFLLCVNALAAGSGAGAQPAPAQAVNGNSSLAPESAVVLELFTSQGCSTCPPADALLSRLAREPQWRGRLVPLALHVDYWNHAGWVDPFSSVDWTDRQHAYSERIGGETYTPQAVINGRRICVGSVEADVRRLLNEAASRSSGRVTLNLRRDGSKIIAEIVAAPPPGRTGDLDVMLAVVESGLETQVKYGENAHRTLHDDFVVRRLERSFKLGAAERKVTTTVRLPRNWNAENTGVSVFLQEPKTREIFGGVSAGLPQ